MTTKKSGAFYMLNPNPNPNPKLTCSLLLSAWSDLRHQSRFLAVSHCLPTSLEAHRVLGILDRGCICVGRGPGCGPCAVRRRHSRQPRRSRLGPPGPRPRPLLDLDLSAFPAMGHTGLDETAALVLDFLDVFIHAEMER